MHSKILLIDPLSDDPLICTGSANFSTNSLISNDENMLLIRGETRVADIYLTELDRIFKHFYDRDAINRIASRGGTPEGLHLDKTPKWVAANFISGTYKQNRLLTFFPETADCTWVTNASHDSDPFADEQKRADARRRARNDAARKRRGKAAGSRTPAKPAKRKGAGALKRTTPASSRSKKAALRRKSAKR